MGARSRRCDVSGSVVDARAGVRWAEPIDFGDEGVAGLVLDGGNDLHLVSSVTSRTRVLFNFRGFLAIHHGVEGRNTTRLD